MSLSLFLIGARGCGKTTIGRMLAKTLNYAFSDTDHYLLQTTQKTVADIIAVEGWEGFRARESEALVAVTAPSTVIATGGGMILAENNRRHMTERGRVIYLQASVDDLIARLEASPEPEQRPSLTGLSAREEIASVLAQRNTLYLQAAHDVINASQSPEQIIKQLLSRLSLPCAN